MIAPEPQERGGPASADHRTRRFAPDYPRDLVMPDAQTFLERFGPCGVIDSSATCTDGGIEQQITDTGPLTREGMERVDDDTSDRAIASIREQEAAGTPWFVWWTGTRMHFRTHVSEEMRGRADDIADETILFYSTDNGPHMNTWPDAGMTPFWRRRTRTGRADGGCRPWCAGRGASSPARSPNGIVHHVDWFPTFLAVAGNEGVKEQLLGGVTVEEVGGRRDRVRLDGYNDLPHLTGETEESPRKELFHFSEDGDLTALRCTDWKLLFMEQKA